MICQGEESTSGAISARILDSFFQNRTAGPTRRTAMRRTRGLHAKDENEHAQVQTPQGCEYFRSQADMPPRLAEALKHFAFEYGDTYAAYLVTERDREYFWGAGGRGVVGFSRRGRFVTIADGLLAAADDRETLLADFLAFAQLNRWHTSYLNVPRNRNQPFPPSRLRSDQVRRRAARPPAARRLEGEGLGMGAPAGKLLQASRRRDPRGRSGGGRR